MKRNSDDNETKGKIVYRFETPVYPANILYVNLVANYSCTNNCLFCSRPRNKKEVGKPNIYEKKAGSFLFLPAAPSIDEIMDSIDAEIKKDDVELAIIGLGEPLIYLPTAVEVIKKVKEKYHIRARVDTNGLVKCMYSDPAKILEETGLDEIRISLNAINEEEYVKLCKPKFKDAFSNLITFVRECVNSSIDTYVSFVVGFSADGITQRTNEEYKAFALSLRVNPQNIIFRTYVSLD
ncbi:radical SAM protein [Candidatus Woesearchaeota archaeon]|nr:radical SAM protein [Candidatus Woesearchaeota archaeon]